MFSVKVIDVLRNELLDTPIRDAFKNMGLDYARAHTDSTVICG
jgi:hypothetical protein